MHRRSRLVIGSAIALATFAALVAAAAWWIRGTASDTAPPPPGSPEAVVATYVTAVVDGDVALARSTFGDALTARCSSARLTRIVSDADLTRSGGVTSRIVDQGELSDGRLRIDVRFTTTWVEPPFSVGEEAMVASFTLREVEGAWQLDAVGWPQPCP